MSLTLFAQSVVGGILVGGIYGMLALGLSLSWGLLRLVNLGHFALAFLSAYLVYHLGAKLGFPIWMSAAVVVPSFFLIGIALHTIFVRFKVGEFPSMLVSFAVAILIQSLIQWVWTADFLRYETDYTHDTIRIGSLYVPTLDLIAFICAVCMAAAAWFVLNRTMIGRALRASAFDAPIAAAFGIDALKLSYFLVGLCSATAGAAGVFIALTSTLAPTQIEAWIGVVFAVVIIGGLGNPLGALGAGVLVAVSEAITMAAVNPAWAPLVAFSILISLLLWQPKWIRG